MANFKYAAINEAPIYESVIGNKGKKIVNRILLGTYIKIIETDGDWVKVDTAGPGGWMHSGDLGPHMGLKVFFLDVGQGDGMLIEVGNYKILIDAGPGESMYNYLTKWQYKYLLLANRKIHIDYLIVSHFDVDHYHGFIDILLNQGFTFGTVCHSGILKFSEKDNPYNSGLGQTIEDDDKYLTRIFNDLLTDTDIAPFNRDITNFIEALNTASQSNRLSSCIRLKAGDILLQEPIDGVNFTVEVLAPFTETLSDGSAGFVYWTDEGKTINGHSVVLKITYGNRSLLVGGDLNKSSENYLMTKYGTSNPFEVDVAKSCHHGSSDFSEKFMSKISPYATVISSGDNEGHSHPRADAIGCAGKYSKGSSPLVFSTELARSTNLKENSILFGMINLRTDGSKLHISQMKEVKKNSDLWDSYEVGPVIL